MLRHTFCHLPRVGEKTEGLLWAAGLATWDDALNPDRLRTAPLARRLPAAELRASAEHLGRANPDWFARRLPPAQVWRLFGEFRAACAYLDIETTGMSAYDDVTAIALYDGRSVRTYVRGQNLADFQRDIQAYRLLVTYNGRSFDLPFLERSMGWALGQAHIDLRHVLKSLGISGGLKRCERQLGLARPGLEDLDGYAAVLLWSEYQRLRDARALETLLAYNVQDTVNLEMLMVEAYNRKLAGLGPAWAASYHLPMPRPAANPYQADPDMVRRVVGNNPWYRCSSVY